MKVSQHLAQAVFAIVIFGTPVLAADGTACKVDKDCKVGDLCSAKGVCELAVCVEMVAPVCGEDGRTYGNNCLARAAHVLVASEGECQGSTGSSGGGESLACGGIANKGCPSGMTCDHPAGTCKTADLEGVCVELPDVCPEGSEPVCGCDGKTYDSDCLRLKAGASKDHDGACR